MRSHDACLTGRLAAVALAALLGAGCHKPAPDQGKGVARLVVRALADSPSIARISVQVSRGGGSDFQPITAELARSGSQWIGRIADIPAGTQRQFDATAFDAGGASLYTGAARSDIQTGGVAVVTIVLNDVQPPPHENSFPVIDSLAYSRERVLPGGEVQLIASAHDPDPGDTITYRWAADCGSFADPAAAATRWTAPASEGPCHLSFQVTDDHGAATSLAFTIEVTRDLGSVDVTVVLNSWPIITGVGGTVEIGAAMQGDLAVQAADPDGDPLTYAWTSDCAGIQFDVSPPRTPATPHFTLPLPPVSCAITVSVSDGKVPGGTIAILHLPPGTISQRCIGISCQVGLVCDPADGLCKANPDRCADVICNASDLCHLPGTCDPATATCSPETLKPCPSGQACDPATGQCTSSCIPACAARACGPDGCGGSCAPGCSGTDTCNASGQCVPPVCTPSCTGRVCGPDGCGGSCAPGCSGTDSCNAGGQCVPASVGFTPQVGHDLQISPPSAIAMDASGNTLVAGLVFSLVDVNFQTRPAGPPINVHSVSGQDIFVASYDPTGAINWALGIGDDDPIGNPADQAAYGVAATQDGTMVIYGKASGAVTIGPNTIGTAAGVPFIAGLAASNGAGRWAKSFNLGNNGYFRSIASRPNAAQNRFAICGQANVAATQLVPGAVLGGGGPSITDIVIAVFDSAGNRIWSAQVGGTGTESCNAVAFDDAGDVYATGWFDTASIVFPGTTPAAQRTVTGPGTATRKAMWVAKFAGAGNGSGGANVLQAVAYTGSFGNANPSTIATSPDGGVWVAGQYTGDITFGGVCPALPAPPGVDCLTEAGGGDGFFAKLDGTSLAPVFRASRLGGTGNDQVKSLAVASSGQAILVGTFNPSSAAFRTANGGHDTTGAASLDGFGNSDILVLAVDGLTGATRFAQAYGNNLNQNGDAVVVNRYGADQTAFIATNVGNTTFGPAGVVRADGGTDAALVFARLQ